MKLDKEIISVKDSAGNVYSMPSKTNTCILSVYYSTSYMQFVVQDKVVRNGVDSYPEKNIYVLFEGANLVDLLALGEGEIGKIVKGVSSCN